MFLESIPVLAAVKERLNWLQHRQGLLAENVANADTPGYRARDLKQPSFEELLGSSQTAMRARLTDANHMVASSETGGDRFAAFESHMEATTPGGNSVVLEQEMLKVSQNQMDYQTATGLYSKSLGLLRMALGRSAAS